MKARLGIFGGTFDPIHNGHLDVARAAQRALSLDALLVMPSHVPPHRPVPAASPFHRFAMVSLAVNGQPGWRASDMELKQRSRSYTAVTLGRVARAGLRPPQIFFILGMDAFTPIETWKDYPALLDLANFVVVSRPGTHVAKAIEGLPVLAGRWREPAALDETSTAVVLLDVVTSDVSSTNIRQRCANSQSIDGLVPNAVALHIEQHGLYQSIGADRRAVDSSFMPAAGRLHGQE